MNGLTRRAASEFVGTAFLLIAVVGSGIMATRMSPQDPGLQLLQNSIATGAALAALIVALQPVSASFNPLITLIERALRMVDTRTALALLAAQFAGGLAGTVVANLMFGLPGATFSGRVRTGPDLWLGEVVATLGLVLIVFGTVRSGRAHRVGLAVGAYIAGAYWFTSSTSFANPAVTVARAITDTFAGIAPASAPGFVLAQVVGGALGLLLVRFLYPALAGASPAGPPSEPKVLS